MHSPREILIGIAYKYHGDWDKIYQSLYKKEDIKIEEINDALNSIKCHTLTILDEEYPETLRNIYRPPFVLYYYGDISLIKDYTKCLAVVGSRDYSPYGETSTRNIVKDLKEDIIVVSGLAKGIDAIAHEEAIKSHHKTIAVLGTGIDYCYPLENIHLYEEIKKNHLLLSEYYGDFSGKPENFPIRNRIIVGLSKAVLVTEAKEKSGTLTSVSIASTNNRDLLVIPYPIDVKNECNHLIQLGAYLVTSGEDVNDLM